MCGIFFSIGFENLSSRVIDSVAHRGPDGRGWNEFISSNGIAIMAHRRLAIVDLSDDGHQPMSSQDGRYWLTYNGEIYNYLEIKQELKNLGYQFRTKTDTEVLLKSYIHWGADCLHKFNGMFAFVIWDDKDKKVFAARDRFGVKPLYYYQQGNKIAFASEIKQFKNISGWQSNLNQEMATEYNENGYCDHKETTLYENVYQVLSGHHIDIYYDSNILKQKCWYNLKDQIKKININDEHAVSQFIKLFSDAIKLRLSSDVEVGACLSGGLDSSSIVSTLRDIMGPEQRISTFSSVFPGHNVDESRYINELITTKNLTSYKNHPTVEDFEKNLDLLLHHQDLPFLSTSIFAQWKTFEDAKENNIVVLLDGQGADESLLGYPGMLNSIIFDYLYKFEFVSLYKFLKWQTDYNQHPLKKILLIALQDRFAKFYHLLASIRGHDFINKSQSHATITDVCLDHFTRSLQTLLRYEDRNSMAFSRESRLPFLDYRLVEFVLSLSIDKKFRNTTTKWLLRESMKDTNIQSILNRKDKIGFATPEKAWFDQLNLKNTVPDFKTYIYNRWLLNENFQSK